MTIPSARLYFFYQPGCPACTSAEPQLARFSRANPHLMVLRKNALKSVPVAGFDPKGTPAYLLMVDGEPVWRHEGILLSDQLQKMWGQALEGETPEPIVDDEDDEDSFPKKRKGREEDETADEEAGRIEDGRQRDEEEE